MLDEEGMQRIYAIQRQMHDKFRNTPAGHVIEYLGRKFVVQPSVFWPHEDSKALVKNYTLNPGEDALDVCTGSGVIAVFSASKGARKVVALDINPEAVRCAKENAIMNGFGDRIEARVSDVFSGLKAGEEFDVITMNPPFTPHKVSDYAEMTVWDDDMHVHKMFFSQVGNFLKPNGRIYITQAKFGGIEEMKRLADSAGLSVRQIGENKIDEDRIFYAFELRRKEE